MKNNKNLIITLLVILGLSIAILFFIKDKQKKEAKKLLEDAAKATQNPDSVNNPGLSGTPPFVANDTPVKVLTNLTSDSTFPLVVGSTGKAVAILQVALNSDITGVLTEKDALKIKVLKRPFPLSKADHLRIVFINGFKNYFPLKKGSKGKYVGALQIMIGLPIDGDFGTNTEKVVKEFTNNTSISGDSFFNLYRSTVYGG